MEYRLRSREGAIGTGSLAARRSLFSLVTVALVLASGCGAVSSGGSSTDGTSGSTAPPSTTTSTTEATASTATTTAAEAVARAASTATSTRTMARPDTLESILYRLARADDPEAFAANHSLLHRNDSVLVVVELASGTDLPEGYEFDVTVRQDRVVEAYVPASALISLAGESNVTAVRTPDRVHPQDP